MAGETAEDDGVLFVAILLRIKATDGCKTHTLVHDLTNVAKLCYQGLWQWEILW